MEKCRFGRKRERGERILKQSLFDIRAKNLLLLNGGESFLSFKIPCFLCKESYCERIMEDDVIGYYEGACDPVAMT